LNARDVSLTQEQVPLAYPPACFRGGRPQTVGVVLEQELLPGIARCRLVGGRHDGLPVVTKPGGFGKGDALCRILALWRGEGERVGRVAG